MSRKRSAALQHLAAAAPADVPAVDEQQDEPAPRRVLVAAEVRGPGAAAARGGSRSRPTYSTETTRRGLPVHLDPEVLRAEAEHGPPVRVHDARVHRHDVDADPEDGRLAAAGGRLAGLACAGAPAPTPRSERRHERTRTSPHPHLPPAAAR